jgi:hypothetical protein
VTVYKVLKSIGRLSFPIYCFLLVEGLIHTKSRLKHAFMLLLFAFISEIPYDLTRGKLIDFSKQNIMFLLFIGFVVIWITDTVVNRESDYPKALDAIFPPALLDGIIIVLSVVIGCVMVVLLKCSYSFPGILLIVSFYVFYSNHVKKMVANVIFNVAFYGVGIQWLGVISVIPIELYNGNPGKYKWKYFFYLFYPLHLLILIVVRALIC